MSITMVSTKRKTVALVFLSISTISSARRVPFPRVIAQLFLHKNRNQPSAFDGISNSPQCDVFVSMEKQPDGSSLLLRGGAAAVNPFPSGYNPFGYALTDLGKQYLKFNGSTESDIGRFLSTLKSGRKKEATIREQWLEIVRVSKKGENMRIYRTLDELIKFCLSAGFID